MKPPSLSEALTHYFSPENINGLSNQPLRWFLCIDTIERAINNGLTEQIFEILCYPPAEARYAEYGEKILPNCDKEKQLEAGKMEVLEIAQITWSVRFATDKFTLYKLGLIGVKKNGDLRQAQLLTKEKQALNLYRWKSFRDNPSLFDGVIANAMKESNYAFFRNLSDVLKKPARIIESEPESPHEKLQRLILRTWLSNVNSHPPLCNFSDDAMLDYLQRTLEKARIVGKDTSYLDAIEHIADARTLRYIWERLGLVRPKKPIFLSALWKNERRDQSKNDILLVRDWR